MEQSLQQIQLKEQTYSTHETTFHIKKVNASDKIPEVAVNFPILSKMNDNDGEQYGSTSQLVRSTPVFNTDRNYFTPCFVLESDLEKVGKNLNSYYNFHINKVNQMEEEKDQIFVAKPSKNHTFCGICRQHYEDYFQHVNGQHHKDKLLKAKLQKNITGFMKILQKKDKRTSKTVKPIEKPAKRGRPSKKQLRPVQNIENTLNLRSDEEGQGIDSQLLAKKQPQTISAGIVEPMSWVGQFLA